MKYTKEERLDIGRQVHTHQLSRKEAVEKYGLSEACVDRYIHRYRKANNIPTRDSDPLPEKRTISRSITNPDIDAYMAMSKEELINELILAKANELRAKKGYEVKGAGADKEYVTLNSRNTK